MKPSAIRRRLLAGLVAAPWVAATRAQDAVPWRIGQSIALSGPLGDLGQAMHQGAKACFAAVNAKGGIHGRPIELQVRDDGYDVPRALANAQAFLTDKDCFALFNCMGTPMIGAMLPKVLENGVPFFAPFTGALLARPPGARNVFNIRASYPDEAEQLVQHLATIGIKRIGIAYQNNAFGKEVLAGAQVAMEKHKLGGATTVTVENDGKDAAQAAAKLAAAAPEAVLVGLAGKPTLDFVKAIRAQRRGLPLYALSVMGPAATLRALGDDATGIAVSQVVPSPGNAVVPVVREFQQAWKAAGVELEPSHLALEGYINARVFCEVLRRAGRNASRAAFIDAGWQLRRYELGGFEVNFSEPGRNASRFVELTMVGRDGRFIR
ncbi:ABC transporter substrate-binding protein [Caenimonas sedimenti]|uniref:ABC transporter substrate-binding protein n=1 Tax=Caenimonas sedimenti TaxID=2596921 RepID=A0A562ZFB4_9BURK|nr:ABC transporter substrate-binding protein [Caenimonas sedimenti]TWO66135.1 ABC transporter substrate-binding protein [Caenimonas sedimenti]